MDSGLNQKMNQLIHELEKLPGIGRRSAERMAYHLLVTPNEEIQPLIESLQELKKGTHHCSICYNISDQDPCEICQDSERNSQLLCIVEQPRDVVKFEKSGAYNGLYHVLHGHLSPLNGISENHLTLEGLMTRLKKQSFDEVVLATGVDLAGEATALHLQDLLQNFSGRITRIARGLPTGSPLEFASDAMLLDALEGRREIHPSTSSNSSKKGQALTEWVLLLFFVGLSLIFIWGQLTSHSLVESFFTPTLEDYNSWWQWPIP